ncbi:MAG: prepilin-type N-terminal cleavage/methylation domain-containing protein [Rickettsiales bacterium]|nr:prepilin-type N-terminal cleavage/methylation domain-containing protein [Rickettsiales bacterium]
MQHKTKNGFTLLELMVVLAIIATATIFAIPNFKEWQVRDSLENSINTIYSNLTEARLSAFSLNTTTRVNISKSGNNYTISTFKFATPTNTCNPAMAGWSSLKTTQIRLNENFNISGSGIGDICFYRDSSSNGGALNFTEVNSPAIYNMSANIDVIIATGFVDLIKN